MPIIPKGKKKYSLDLTMFGRQGMQSSKENTKDRKMTYDVGTTPTRAANPLEKDTMFQKINQEGT